MSKFYVGSIYFTVHVVAAFCAVTLARSLGGVPDTGGLTHLHAGVIATVWHLPLTAFIYRFTRREVGGVLGVE